MNDGKIDWEGNFVAAVTPFTEGGELDEKAFRRNLELVVDEGAEGVIAGGCTGEAWALTEEERVRLAEVAVETVGRRVPVLAGTGGISTDGVIELSLRTKQRGVAGVMILPPYYCLVGRKDVLAHYKAISDSVKHPILLYNIPRRTGFNLTPDVVEELARLDWVVAIKESSDDFVQVEATIQRVGDVIKVFTGHSAERAVPALLMGAKGFVSSLESQVMGRDAVELYTFFKDGRLPLAREIQMRALALNEGLRRIGTFPANLKAAMNARGRPGGFPRRPIQPLTTAEIGQVRTVLERMDLGVAAAS